MGCCGDDDDGISSSDIILNPTAPCANPVAPCNTVSPCASPTPVGRPSGGCGHRHPVPGCCTPFPATPVPFYLRTAECVQDHNSVCDQSNPVAIRVANSFNMPACGSATILSVPGIDQVLIGGYFWNPSTGYLKVNSFDQNQAQVTVTNECQTGNAAPGTQVPACSYFIMSPGPSSSGGGINPTSPYLALDFIAPAVSTCIPIAVTTAAGLMVSSDVSIAGGTYRIGEVIDGFTIQICNDGDGIVANTPVLARNAANVLQYPVIQIATNPCTNPVDTNGRVLVCSSGIIKPLGGTAAGQVLALTDPDTNIVEFKSLGIPLLDCTTLTQSLTVDPSNPSGTIYLAVVGDALPFSADELITIGADQFTVHDRIDEVHIHVIPVVNPTEVTTYPVGASFCSAGCCAQLTVDIANLEATLSVQGSSVIAGLSAPVVLTTVSQTTSNNIATLTVTNSSTSTLDIYLTIDTFFKWVIASTAGRGVRVDYFVNLGEGVNNTTPSFSTLYGASEADVITSGIDCFHTQQLSKSGVASIAPGQTYTIRVQLAVTYGQGTAESLTVENADATITIIAVSV